MKLGLVAREQRLPPSLQPWYVPLDRDWFMWTDSFKLERPDFYPSFLVDGEAPHPHL